MSAYPIPYFLKPDDQLFFLHIPKTAGTTLISLLDQHFSPSEICPEQLAQKVKNLSANDMARYRLFRGHLDYDLYKLLPQKPIYITMLRHPLKRVVSLYEFWKRNSEGWVADHPVYENIFRSAIQSDLHQFVCSNEQFIRLEVENNQVRRIVANTRDPLDFLSDQDCLEIAKKRISEEFLFFGLLERFDESLQLLCYSLGWPPIQSYEKGMVSPKPIKIEDLPAQTRDAILERNQLDLELYNYASRLFNERYQAMIHQLIEKSYQDHFAQWNVVGDRWEITMGQAISGSNWYTVEFTPDGKPFRWIGPKNEAFIDICLQRHCSYAVTFEIVNAIRLDLLDTVKFTVNGNAVSIKKTSGENHQGIFQGVILPEVVDLNPYLTRLSFQVSRTISPQELDPNSLDPRQLSLAVHKIIIESIHPDEEGLIKENTELV